MKTLSPTEAHDHLQNTPATALDVRTPAEFSEKHLAEARHIPVDELASRHKELDASQPYCLICQSGPRAERAHRILSEAGFTDLSVLSGGLGAWEEQGLPLERGESKTLPLMRQVQLTVGLAVLLFSLLAFFAHPAFALGAAFFGAGLTLAGATGWCGLAILLSNMPWNQSSCCRGKK
ncbi:rhodanese-like domain-containing protein [Roseibacillus ishigakijimensis]|uniref:Rhodanese-like domain-containing protein n=1 Tax=Roseibacillus ishigakijimensis TaxID=454146 RepID=A0A934VLY1_9BACT|nr:rhodanese-like domain-containing protein [Roseibacillus ishigakijimensis]MBK1833551.1 rhodanese-like domain-containing protein [Roseibacillus ishigakijimensis]